MNAPLEARSLVELGYYLMVTPCPTCGEGPLDPSSSPRPAGPVESADVQCRRCGAEHRWPLASPLDAPPAGAAGEVINPTDEPSRIVDLAQWLSVYYLLVESAAGGDGDSVTRRQGYRAALCLAEALKFYGDHDRPPEEAFFHEASRRACREHPEGFSRQRLLAMQARLPSLEVMRQWLDDDQDPTPARRWWQFWRRGQDSSQEPG